MSDHFARTSFRKPDPINRPPHGRRSRLLTGHTQLSSVSKRRHVDTHHVSSHDDSIY